MFTLWLKCKNEIFAFTWNEKKNTKKIKIKNGGFTVRLACEYWYTYMHEYNCCAKLVSEFLCAEIRREKKNRKQNLAVFYWKCIRVSENGKKKEAKSPNFELCISFQFNLFIFILKKNKRISSFSHTLTCATCFLLAYSFIYSLICLFGSFFSIFCGVFLLLIFRQLIYFFHSFFSHILSLSLSHRWNMLIRILQYINYVLVSAYEPSLPSRNRFSYEILFCERVSLLNKKTKFIYIWVPIIVYCRYVVRKWNRFFYYIETTKKTQQNLHCLWQRKNVFVCRFYFISIRLNRTRWIISISTMKRKW